MAPMSDTIEQSYLQLFMIREINELDAVSDDTIEAIDTAMDLHTFGNVPHIM